MKIFRDTILIIIGILTAFFLVGGLLKYIEWVSEFWGIY